MAHTWRFAFGLGLLGAAITTGCVVTTDDSPDSGFSGEAGEGASGGSGGTTGGSGGKGGASGGTSGKGGTGGATAGKGGAGGSGGTGDAGAGAEAGAGATTGGTAGAATGGSAGAAGGSAGERPEPDDTIPECDPPNGELDNTPYPGCAPEDPTDPTDCEDCIQRECCEESIACYSFAPGNVCGWGGPDSGEMYAGSGEIGCYVQCLSDYVGTMELCDEEGRDLCIGMCQTTMCSDSVLGTRTSELAGCLHDSCSEECFGAATCGD